MAEQLRLAGFDERPTLDVHDLILPKGMLDEPEPKPKKAAPQPVFEIAFESGADWAVRRIVGQRSSVLVLMVTQGQYYVRDERTGRVKPVTKDTFKTFTAGSTWADSTTLTPPWLDRPIRDMSPKARATMLEMLENPCMREFVKRDMVQLEGYLLERGYTLRNQGRLALFAEKKAVVKAMWEASCDAHGRDTTAESLFASLVNATGRGTRVFDGFEYAVALAESLSVDTMRAIVGAVVRNEREMYERADTALAYIVSAAADISAVGTVDQKALVRYVEALTTCQRHFGRRGPFGTWSQAVRQQLSVLGRIETRYPDDPAATLAEVERIAAAHRYEATDAKIARRAAALARREWSDGTLAVTVPRSAMELEDEGKAMRNCIGTFVNAYASGICELYFIRSCSAPDKPLIDVEVRDGEVRQAFQSCNRSLDEDQMEFLRAWCREKGIHLSQRHLAARYA